MPSTRDLARQLGVSRGVVVDAYAQLGAEGYSSAPGGAAARLRRCGGRRAGAEEAPPGPAPRFDFRPGVPDVSLFPRDAWLRPASSARGDDRRRPRLRRPARRGPALRGALADYLGRVRGVVADPAARVVTGYRQGLGLVCRALAASGAGGSRSRTRAIPSRPGRGRGPGSSPCRSRSTGRACASTSSSGRAPTQCILTPAHQHPTGGALSGERRAALMAWLRERDAIAIEDDYDAEYRYDRAADRRAAGARARARRLRGDGEQDARPRRCGSAGWSSRRRWSPPCAEEAPADRGTARIEQHAFAEFLGAASSTATCGACARATARGATRSSRRWPRSCPRRAGDRGRAARDRRLPEADDEAQSARRPGGAGSPSRRWRTSGRPHRPATLLLGYGQIAEPAIRAGVRELAEAIRTTRA